MSLGGFGGKVSGEGVVINNDAVDRETASTCLLFDDIDHGLQRLSNLITTIKCGGDVVKVRRGELAASARVRNNLLQIRELALSLRKSILVYRKAVRGSTAKPRISFTDNSFCL